MTATRDDASAWLDTLDPESLDTIKQAAETRSTIVPPAMRASGARALAVLEQLRGRSAAESAHLVHGDVLGEGGMGVVRAAEQVALGRTVAVKTLKRRDPEAALALLREAWVTGAIEHPNVVPVHYVELDGDGMPLVVMKRIAGVEWSKLIDRADEVERRFGATDLLAWNLAILMQVLNAIRFAHHRGVIHRDLKPSNVMIGDFGEVYLLDWGIAVSLRDDPSGRLPIAAHQSEMAGTPAYMAPEMLGRAGDPPQTERTDVYLAGAVLYEIVVGSPPHRGTDILAVIADILTSAPHLPADAPAELGRICARAMHADPAQRFESAEALRLALQGYLEHRDSAELAQRAGVRLAELDALLAASDADHDAVHGAFGACRFGFHEALARWPDNTDAAAGLARATIAVAEYELAHGQPAAAETLLAGIDAPALAARVAAAKAETAKQLAEAARLRADSDPDVGRRTRTALVSMFGVVFVALPLVSRLLPVLEDGLHVAALSAGILVGICVAYLWAHDSLGATLFNRRLVRSCAFLFAMQIVLGLVAWRIDLDPTTLGLVLLFAWALLSGMVAIALDSRLAPASGVYLAALVFATAWPEARELAIAGGNLAMTVTCVWVWWPTTWQPTPEEVARFKLTGRRARALQRRP
nr:serine/threonine-protein kinase [Kofleriaceae bacterium]